MTNTINTTTYTINPCCLDTALFTGVDHLVDSGAGIALAGDPLVDSGSGIALAGDTNTWAEVLRTSGIAGPTLVYNGSRWFEVRRASGPGIALNMANGPGIALNNASSPGIALNNESGPGILLNNESGPGIALNNASGPGIALKWGVDLCRSQSQVYDSEMPSITTLLCGA